MLERMLSRVSVRSRALPHISPSALHHQHTVVRQPLVLSIRTYATPGRPKSVVGEPSRTVKRAVKKAASKPNDGSSAAEKKIAAKARSPATKRTRALTPEQAAKRQEAADLKAARDAARKGRTAQRKAVEKKKTKIEDLKAAALPECPKRTGYTSAYQAYWSQTAKGSGGTASTINAMIKEAAAKWKEMGPADIEHYNHIRRTANEAAAANYKQWIESHSADQIRLANLARAQLRREFPKQKNKWVELQDERRPKRPQSPYLSFSLNRQSSGDFTNIKITERSKLISQEWKALSTSEKEKYEQLYKQDQARYHEEHSRVYGFAPPAAKTTAAAAAA
ncbi:Putative High mobility group box domain-containing protein [Septoria linicola]|uniref:High mobility group box domain-containing protein n=1 Tax=Septoria linicola TaxID=215465 RepID=A0A9Q9AJX6_9PEZI|nr:putative High mobility group box domain-containing protein [Septoria linicola]USW47800.1 Putative High mobility group box domain-containing protein [Septoria linicola]